MYFMCERIEPRNTRKWRCEGLSKPESSRHSNPDPGKGSWPNPHRHQPNVLELPP